MIEKILLPISGAIFLAFPYFYILLKKGHNKFLFISSVIGGTSIVIGLLYIFSLPFAIFLIKVIPQLAEYRQIDSLLPLLRVINFIQEYYIFVAYPLLNIALPILIYRRYTLFQNIKTVTTNTSNYLMEGTTK